LIHSFEDWKSKVGQPMYLTSGEGLMEVAHVGRRDHIQTEREGGPRLAPFKNQVRSPRRTTSKGSTLNELGRCSATWAKPPALFVLVILKTSLIFAQDGLDSSYPVYVSHCSWDDRHMPPRPIFFPVEKGSQKCLPNLSLPSRWVDRRAPPHPATGWDGVLLNFCPGWSQTTILLISASQVARL
jgi:hypothetical protein